MPKLSSAWQTHGGTSRVLFTLYSSRKWCTDRIWHGDRYTDQSMHPRCQMDWYLPANHNSSISMEVSSRFSAHCVWVKQADPDYPGMCDLLSLVWPSQMVLQQQPHCLLVALELNCCYSQLLPQVCPFHPALCWGWWEANSSYVGSSCTLPHPWSIPHKLVYQDRAAFPQHTPYFPIYPELNDDPWRWLHGLKLYLQPPRLLLYCVCHIAFVAFSFLCLEGLSPFLNPFGAFPHFLHEFSCILCCCGAPDQEQHLLKDVVASCTWDSRGWTL